MSKDENGNSYYLRYYDTIKGRDNDKPGWYTVTVPHNKDNYHPHPHYDMVYWIYDNIPKCEKHCRWNLEKPGSIFKFRFQKHATMFSLRWA